MCGYNKINMWRIILLLLIAFIPLGLSAQMKVESATIDSTDIYTQSLKKYFGEFSVSQTFLLENDLNTTFQVPRYYWHLQNREG